LKCLFHSLQNGLISICAKAAMPSWLPPSGTTT
jgi:hypothetical protein